MKRLLAFFCLFSLISCNQDSTEKSEVEPSEATYFQTSKIDVSQKFYISQKLEDLELARNIDKIIDQSKFSNARWGIFVVSLTEGRILTAKNGRKAFIPASVLKILTSIVALDMLGKDFRWTTRIFAKGKLENGVLEGDLILYEAAPDLDDSGIKKLAEQLKEKGLKVVKGNILGDDSFNGSKLSGNEWKWYHEAKVSVPNVNPSRARIVDVSFFPTNESTKINPNLESSSESDENPIGQKLRTKNIKNFSLLAAKALADKLKKSGIKIEGNVQSVDWKSKKKADLQKATEIASLESQTLEEIIKKMNKDSLNLYAELILRTLSKHFGENTFEEVRGNDRTRTAVIKRWLTEKGIKLQENESISDGSGLSRNNLLTPETVAKILILGTQIKDSKVFLESLPVAGKDGTLRHRLTNLSGKVIAKTGSIFSVSSLAGYIKRQSGETLSFVIFCNDFPNSNEVNTVIDKIVSQIAS